MVPLQIALSALCLLSALWLVVLIVRDRTPDDAHAQLRWAWSRSA